MKKLIANALFVFLLATQSLVWADDDETIEAYNWKMHIVTTVIKNYKVANGNTVGTETTIILTTLVHLDGSDVLSSEIPKVDDESKELFTIAVRKDANSDGVILEKNSIVEKGMKEFLLLCVATKNIDGSDVEGKLPPTIEKSSPSNSNQNPIFSSLQN